MEMFAKHQTCSYLVWFTVPTILGFMSSFGKGFQDGKGVFSSPLGMIPQPAVHNFHLQN